MIKLSVGTDKPNKYPRKQNGKLVAPCSSCVGRNYHRSICQPFVNRLFFLRDQQGYLYFIGAAGCRRLSNYYKNKERK